MGDVTRNFSRHEFACHCGCGLQDPHPVLVCGLQELRDIIGERITVTSGCRCPDHNAAIGGAPESQHLPKANGYCFAADVHVDGESLGVLFEMASLVGGFHRGGIGVYYDKRKNPATWVHLDVRASGPARWGNLHGDSCSQGAVLKAAARRFRTKGGEA